MIKTHRMSRALTWGLIVLAIVSFACTLPSNKRQPVLRDQQNQQNNGQQEQQPNQDENQEPNPEEDQPPDVELEPPQDQENQPGIQDFSVVGIWESQIDTDRGLVSTQLVLEHTGTFSQAVTWNGLMTLDTGVYTIIGNAVHFTVTHHEPTEYMGQPLSWVTSFTYFVTPVDATTMQVEDHIMKTSWTMHKTGP
jgi:hypothetical protein